MKVVVVVFLLFFNQTYLHVFGQQRAVENPFDTSFFKLKYRLADLKFMRINNQAKCEVNLYSDAYGNYKARFEYKKKNDSIIPNGLCNIFYNDSISIINQNYENGILNYETFFFYNHGVEGYEIKGNKINGKYAYYCRNGMMTIEGYYKNNCRDSFWREYYPNDKRTIKSEGNYVPHFLFFNKADTLLNSLLVMNEKHEILDKILLSYNSMKEYMNKLHFEYDLPFGKLPFIYFYKTGDWKYWNENGELIKTETWLNGELIK
jgi:antitoxin component YwqK of YwqJK toxin-antitoxin module